MSDAAGRRDKGYAKWWIILAAVIVIAIALVYVGPFVSTQPGALNSSPTSITETEQPVESVPRPNWMKLPCINLKIIKLPAFRTAQPCGKKTLQGYASNPVHLLASGRREQLTVVTLTRPLQSPSRASPQPLKHSLVPARVVCPVVGRCHFLRVALLPLSK